MSGNDGTASERTREDRAAGRGTTGATGADPDRDDAPGADRRIDVRFLALLVGITAVAAVPAWFAVGRFDGGRPGLALGLGFSLASLAIGFHWIRWSARGEGKRFVAAVMGSMTARVVATLVFALVVAFGTTANLAVALLTVVAMHIVFGMIEVAYFHGTEALG